MFQKDEAAMRRFSTSNLDNLGSQFSIPITADDDGYLGRGVPYRTASDISKLPPVQASRGRLLVTAPIAVIKARATRFSHKSLVPIWTIDSESA